MTPPLLNVTDLSRSFGGRTAVDGVSFRVEQGRTLGLLGPNGAGKSTTVGMICGLIRPDRGEVQIDGEPVAAGSSAARRKIGLVPQDLALYDDLPAIENLRLFGALHGLKGAHLARRCNEVLKLANLSERARDKPATFSGGMKRRLNIAAALLHEPRLLILDEPTVGVDPQSRSAIFDCLEALKERGCALIYTSHYMDEVERLADHIVIIDHGKVIADETPSSLYKRLPAQAALRVELARIPRDDMIAHLRDVDGVADVKCAGHDIRIELSHADHSLPILNWLAAEGAEPVHFTTAKGKLEDIFLTLTGRALRD
jgi:ABC-2 type transport system ATP-binding protein